MDVSKTIYVEAGNGYDAQLSYVFPSKLGDYRAIFTQFTA
ncbi:hypothetical protein CCAN11_110001 [Capnocytophaga canimorsus]|uniref:Uncharacterized protein n=1 Tax=Capnocytophaga canimorsus TaxID=28188 RepID=A0A0B7I3B2_9FLAO|nr:hypothetical protein CCAN11_110001 [Capnocytophaga canimorsus]